MAEIHKPATKLLRDRLRAGKQEGSLRKLLQVLGQSLPEELLEPYCS